MATSIPTLRLVKCPKCSEILTEFSYIPIYQCGGCGTTLRAKNYDAAKQSMACGTLENKLQNLPHCVSLHSGALDEKQGVEFSNNSFEDIPALEHDESCNEEMENDPDCKVESEVNCSFIELDKSSKLNQQGHDTLKLSEGMQDLAESSGSLGTVASEKNWTVWGDQDGHGNISPSSSTTSSNPCDGSVSSDNDRSAPNVSTTFEEGRVDQHEGKQDQYREIVSNANELSKNLDDEGQSGSNANDMVAENKGHRRQHTSLDSQDFHSVQAWFESEDDEPVKFPSKSATLLNSHGGFHMEILRKVDELREEISELFDKSDEGRERSHLRAIQEGSLAKKHDSHFIRLPSKAQSEHVPCMHCHYKEGKTYAKLQHSNCYHSRTNAWNAKLCHQPRIEPVNSSYDKSQSQQMKRHCRPVLGGAPFVTCLNCLQLLQVPIDFFVATKRLHKLRCGACSKVLVFSSRARDCKTPYAVDHSASEAGSSSDATLRHQISNSRLHDRSQSQSISYSTDIELPKHSEKSNGKPVRDGQLQMLLDYGTASELLYRHTGIDEELETTKSTTRHCDRPQEAACLRTGSKDGTTCDIGDMTGDDSRSFSGHVEGGESRRRRRRSCRRATSPLHHLLKSLSLKRSKNGRKHSGQ